MALFGNKLEDQISNLFKIAIKANIDGIVCSPHELKIANIILNIKAPATPHKIIFFLFFGTKFAAINPIIIALSAAKIISIKMICKSMSDSSNNVILF